MNSVHGSLPDSCETAITCPIGGAESRGVKDEKTAEDARNAE
jgi:hypothetical protein